MYFLGDRAEVLDFWATMGPTRHMCVQFGIYEVDLDSGELRKSGLRIKVQQQPFKVLQALLERPGEVVTREELHDRIWPETSFGDFDQAVNVAVAKLRTALSDSAENPRFIETVPRRGYRFIAPVQGQVNTPTQIVTGDVVAAGTGVAAPVRSGRLKPAILIGAVVVGIIAVAAIFLLSRRSTLPNYSFHRISFGKGAVRSARFAPDGQSILYGAAWDGKAMQLFWTQAQSPESRPYSLPDADILAVSPEGELAVLLNRRAGVGWISHGTLGLMPTAGAPPREILENVQDADWDAAGKNLAVVHWQGKRCNLEYPMGNVIYGVTGGHWLSNVRISPRGDRLAFLEHPLEGDDAGVVAMVDFSGRKKVLTHFWLSVRGLAWDPADDALWFSASEPIGGRDRPRAVYRLSLPDKLQVVISESGNLTLHDVSHERGLLVSRDTERYEVLGNIGGQSRDLSWLDFSRGDDLSADGANVLITVEGEAAGENYEVYLRKTDGSQPVRLGEGYGSAISPDGQWALAIMPFSPGTDAAPQLMLLPVAKGSGKVLTRDAIAHYSGGWLPDGKHIVFVGSEPGHGARAWIQDLEGGAPKPVTPEDIVGTRVSPDGKFLSAIDAEGNIVLCSLAGGNAERLKGAQSGERPLNWSKDGQDLFVLRSDYLPVKVYRVNISSGKRELLRELSPADPAGVIPDISSVFTTADGGNSVYSYFRLQSDLYMAAAK